MLDAGSDSGSTAPSRRLAGSDVAEGIPSAPTRRACGPRPPDPDPTTWTACRPPPVVARGGRSGTWPCARSSPQGARPGGGWGFASPPPPRRPSGSAASGPGRPLPLPPGGPGAAFPRVWASARRGVRWAGAHRVRRPGGSPSTGDRTSDLHDVREEIALAHPVDHLPERVAAALRDMGWRRVEREGAVVRARRGSPALFRLLGVFILGRRTLPVELRVVGRPDGRSPLVGHGSPRGGTRTRRSSPPPRGPWRHTGARWSVNRRAGVLAAARGRARGQASGVRWVWR
jgi:hypothetical protein